MFTSDDPGVQIDPSPLKLLGRIYRTSLNQEIGCSRFDWSDDPLKKTIKPSVVLLKMCLKVLP